MTASDARKVLVMGIGNTLLQDDGIGVHVTELFKSLSPADPNVEVLDGGTIGLSLLPEIEDADAVVIVDASEIGERPGTIRIFRGQEIDRQLSGKKRSVHEVALYDLFSAAAIRDRSPEQRVLIAIQPASTEWGLEPTPEVKAAIPAACDALTSLTRQWQDAAR
ncbi:MAG: HyaD/HybD family hydrogenase maturation endopeptidase [Xanthomonadales bacterium]|jgi:hydrogenase maturation protease|nr:HyaD/HybD family hydrogenase maturation endopeptidase [Xanthomonadales bacterium]